jgi:undecaprenyl-diphosphatase
MESLLELDARLSQRLRVAERPGLLRLLAVFLAHSGDSWFWLLGLGILWLVGSDFWKSRALVLAASVLITATIVLLIKFAVRRRRPEGEWGSIYRSTDPHSFPSGHAARAVMLAVMAALLGPSWLAALLLVWAPLVSLARIAMGLHFVSDVAAGIALGIAAGLILGRFF